MHGQRFHAAEGWPPGGRSAARAEERVGSLETAGEFNAEGLPLFPEHPILRRPPNLRAIFRLALAR